jgi:hypothetical protein
MRQLPAPYWSEVHGPVFAYAARGDTRACCVTWRDDYVLLHHDDLLPLPRLGGKPDATYPGVEQVLDLDAAVTDAMTPHVLDGGGVKPSLPRRFDVGAAILAGPLFWNAVHAPGEEVTQGFDKPPRTASEEAA